jgi:hypothetical protein
MPLSLMFMLIWPHLMLCWVTLKSGAEWSRFGVSVSETRMVRLYRVGYDVELTQFKMKQHNLPVRLVSRLSQGL